MECQSRENVRMRFSITVCAQGQVRKDDRAGAYWQRAISHWQAHTDTSVGWRNNEGTCCWKEKSCREREEDYLGDRGRMQLNACRYWRRETSKKEKIEWPRWYAYIRHRLNKQVPEQLWSIGEQRSSKLYDWPRIWAEESFWASGQATTQHVELHNTLSKHP